MERIAVYPGSFDPITNGHLDIIKRGINFFDKLIILVAYNQSKSGFFTVDERIEMIREVVSEDPKITVECWNGLLVDYLNQSGVHAILRGLRAVSDFEFEFQMALMNRRLNRQVESVFLMTGFKWFFTSSTLVKEVANHGGSVKGLVPDPVYRRLQDKLARNGEQE